MTERRDDLTTLAAEVLTAARERGLKIATAESCTGGLVVAALTAVAGSSEVVDRGFVTYSNAAKMEMLGVPAGLIAQYGAVSRPCARAMAEGAIARSEADLAVAITGIAGPGGGNADKPVGLVHFATALKTPDGVAVVHIEHRFGDLGRDGVRRAAQVTALKMLRAAAEG
jgi:nicotinamide-nucleotide amidase